MRLRLTYRWLWMTWTWYTCKFELSWNFAKFRRFGSQQRLNEYRKTRLVCDGSVPGSLLNVLLSGALVTLISQGVPPLGRGVKQHWGGSKLLFVRAKCVNISKTVGDIHPQLLLKTNRDRHEYRSCRQTASAYCWTSSRAFSVAGARVWNALPADVTSAVSLFTFRKRLKLHLFPLS